METFKIKTAKDLKLALDNVRISQKIALESNNIENLKIANFEATKVFEIIELIFPNYSEFEILSN